MAVAAKTMDKDVRKDKDVGNVNDKVVNGKDNDVSSTAHVSIATPAQAQVVADKDVRNDTDVDNGKDKAQSHDKGEKRA